MYKSSYDGGLSKKDIKRIQEIVNNLHAEAMKQDIKDTKFVEGYVRGRKSVTYDIADIADLIYTFADAVENGEYQNVEDIIADIRYHGDMLVELMQDIDSGE